jgi:beta-glucosidase
MEGGFADPRFRTAYLRYTEEFASRYPWVEEYTLFNEPFSTLFLTGHEGIWPPYQKGLDNFVAQILNVLPAVAEASRTYEDLLPDAKHVWVDTCEHHTGAGAGGSAYAAMANERRFLVLDCFLGRYDGRGYDPFGPMAELLRGAGGEKLHDMEPGRIDVLGLDYYAHCQWHFDDQGGSPNTPYPLPLAQQIYLYWDRYRLPCLLTETNVRGRTSDRATWFKYVLEQCERARQMGVPLQGLCWFPVIDVRVLRKSRGRHAVQRAAGLSAGRTRGQLAARLRATNVALELDAGPWRRSGKQPAQHADPDGIEDSQCRVN